MPVDYTSISRVEYKSTAGNNSLNKSAKALKAARVGIETAAQNVENEVNEDYNRREVNLRIDEIRGMLVNVYRVSDEYLREELYTNNSTAEYYKAIHSKMSSLERYISGTKNIEINQDPVQIADNENGIGAALNWLKINMNELSTQPNSVVVKRAVKESMQRLIDSIKNTYGILENAEQQFKTDIKNQVDRVNDLLGQIGKLNEQIYKRSYDLTFALEDKRDEALKELSSYLPIDVNYKTINVNGFNLKICEVSLKKTDVQMHNAALTDEQRKLINGGLNVPIAKFEIGKDNQGKDVIAYTHAGSRDEFTGEINNGQPVGNTNMGADPGVIPAPAPVPDPVPDPIPAKGYDFQNYLQNSYKHGGSISATLNITAGLNNGANNAGKADQSIHNISELKKYLDNLAETLTTKFNLANTDDDELMPENHHLLEFNGAHIAKNLKIADNWQNDMNALQTNKVADIYDTLETQYNELNNIDGSPYTFKGYYNTFIVELGKTVYNANTNLKNEKDKLEAAQDRVDSLSSVDKNESIMDIEKYREMCSLVQGIIKMLIQIRESTLSILNI